MKLVRAWQGDWVEATGYRKKRILDAEDLDQPGTLVQLVVIPPRTSVGLHYHQYATEVFHILSGNGRMNIKGQSIELYPGDTVTTQPGDMHDAHNDGDVPFEYVVFKANWDPSDSIWPGMK